MSAGFQAWTPTGFVQIDSDVGLQNYQLSTKITQSLASGTEQLYYNDVNQTATFPCYKTTFNFTGIAPMLAYYSDSGACLSFKWSNSGSSYSVDIISRVGGNVTLYVFDLNNWSNGTSTYGMQIFNAAGACVADLAVPFARVLGVIEGNISGAGYGASGWSNGANGFPRPGPQTFAFGVAKVAVACVEPAATMSGSNAAAWLSEFTCSGGNVTVAWNPYGSSSGDNYFVGFVENLNWRAVVIDVSNL